MTNIEFVMALGVLLGATTVAAYLAGRGSGNLARMEVTAAVQVAKQEVGWEYQRYRIESMRMGWVDLSVEARQEYVRMWGRPGWAHASKQLAPLDGVTTVRGRT